MSVTVPLQGERNEEILQSYYHDAFVHTKDKMIFNVHKVLLASRSPFFHDYFQSRPGQNVNDVLFLNIPSCIVKPALDLIYNGKVCLEGKHEKRFRWFVQTVLELNTSTDDCDSVSNEQDYEDVDIDSLKEHSIENVETEHTNANREETEMSSTGNNDVPSSLGSMWTLTSPKPAVLKSISHTLIVTKNSKKQNVQNYKCSKTLEDAKKHFGVKHLDCEDEREKLMNATEARRNCWPKILKLSEDLNSGWNVEMVSNELCLIQEELTNHLDIIDGIDKAKYLPPSMFRKKKEMCKAIHETVQLVNSLIVKSKK